MYQTLTCLPPESRAPILKAAQTLNLFKLHALVDNWVFCKMVAALLGLVVLVVVRPSSLSSEKCGLGVRRSEGAFLMPCLHSVSASLYKKNLLTFRFTLSPLKLAKVTAFGSLLD